MPKTAPPDDIELTLSEREQALDALADALAAEQGPPPGGVAWSERDLDRAWEYRDPRATPEAIVPLLQKKLALLTAPEYADPVLGRALRPDEVQGHLEALATDMLHPYRRDTWEPGAVDDEEKVKAAEKRARSAARRREKEADRGD